MNTAHVVYGVEADNSRTSAKAKTYVFHYDGDVSKQDTKAAA